LRDNRSNEDIWADRRERWGNYFTKHPILSIFIVVLFLGGLGFGLKLVMAPINFANQAAQVAQQEFNPHAMLKKYEWFKNAASALTAKKHDLSIMSAKLKPLRAMSRKDMDRQDKQDLAQWEAEVAGVALSYNSLAAEWNSQISKFNWSPFVTALPPGAERVLSQKFAPYMDGV